MRLILLRHGKTEANEQHRYCGSTDHPLSENGKAELEALRNTVSYPEIEACRVITSGMRRTDGTLRILYDRGPDLRLPELREIDFGRFENGTYEELLKDPAYVEWISDTSGDAVPPGGESANAFGARVLKAFERILEEGRDTLIVCHGGVIARIMAYLFPEEARNMYEWQGSCGHGWELRLCGAEKSFRQF